MNTQNFKKAVEDAAKKIGIDMIGFASNEKFKKLSKNIVENPRSRRTFSARDKDLIEPYTYKNVMLLQGNHERWFMHYVNNEIDEIKSTEFKNNTMLALNEFAIKELKAMSKKLIQCAYLTFNDYTFIVTHAGIGFMPDKLKLVASDEFIKGGKYEDNIDVWFEKNNTNDKLIQIHGHRNEYSIEMTDFAHSINLNDKVEFGKDLRILEITK